MRRKKNEGDRPEVEAGAGVAKGVDAGPDMPVIESASAGRDAAAAVRRPRRRRRRSGTRGAAPVAGTTAAAAPDDERAGEPDPVTDGGAVPAPPGEGGSAKPKRRRRRRKAPSGSAVGDGAPRAVDKAAASAGDDESAGTEPVAASEAEVPASGVTETAGEGDEVRTGGRRRRGRRGGRRHRRREGTTTDDKETPEATDAAPAETVVAPAETVAKPAKAKRRRRVASGAGTAAAAEAAPAEGTDDGDADEKRVAARGRRRRPRARREEATVSPDLPGRKEILISNDAEELRVALMEDGRLAEIYFERPHRRSRVGNIYHGKVDAVLPGMEAAFVEIGLDRNGFLSVDEIADPENGEKRPRKISQMLKSRQDVLVQVTKDPMGSKGARLTGQVSLAGRYLVYVPGGGGVGVSRRLADDERERLREICKSLKAKDAGLIVRTVAEGKSVDELRMDLRYLSRLWSRIKAKVGKAPTPVLLHEEDDVSLKVARDLLNETFSRVLVDTPKQGERIVAYLTKTAPELADRVHLYEDDEPLFKTHHVEEQIARALERRVQLPSGGNIVIDHTEALTVIDVNSGKFTGGKGLEDTITHTNLEAAREVVRQLRLRDIGGIIIIDFIDMEHPKNREAVLGKLQAELALDRTKTYVVEISPLGLVEMTRQNITDGARGILTQTCSVCEGKARIPSAETVALSVERRLREHAAETAARALLVELNATVIERMTAGGRVKRLERETKKHYFLEGSRLLPVDTFRIVAEGTIEAVKSHRVPVAEEQELTVELDYALTYSPADAVAHVDGYQVVVLNGRRFLGERRGVRIVSVTRAGAVAALAG